MKKFLPYINFIVSLGAIALSIIAICNVYPRNFDIGFDYLGFIIGILGIIVAVLIGWQLFNAFNLKEYTDQANQAKEMAEKAKVEALDKVEKLFKIVKNLQEERKIEKENTIIIDEIKWKKLMEEK